jgi:ABC-type amino acid transport substrate-binding protein
MERALGTIDRPASPDPGFLDDLFDDLAQEMGFREDGRGVGGRRARRGRRAARGSHQEPRASRRSRPMWVLAAALAGAAVAGALAASFALRPDQEVRLSLLEMVRREGMLTVVVSEGRPQARSPVGSLGGFDIDVAGLLAERLGLEADITAVGDGPSGITVDWEVALPAKGLDRALADRFPVSVPISWWPVRVMVPIGAPFEGLGELAGTSICVVANSTGEAWLTEPGSVRSATPIVQPPAAAMPVIAPDDDACLDALAAGSVSAAVTASIDPAGLATRGDIRAIGGPVLTEERGALVNPATGDPAALLAAIDTAIEAARADGSLADLARARFGGLDLSAPPSTRSEEP